MKSLRKVAKAKRKEKRKRSPRDRYTCLKFKITKTCIFSDTLV